MMLDFWMMFAASANILSIVFRISDQVLRNNTCVYNLAENAGLVSLLCSYLRNKSVGSIT